MKCNICARVKSAEWVHVIVWIEDPLEQQQKKGRVSGGSTGK